MRGARCAARVIRGEPGRRGGRAQRLGGRPGAVAAARGRGGAGWRRALLVPRRSGHARAGKRAARGSGPARRDAMPTTELHNAAKNGRVADLERLIEARADL